ncbi:MAG TPA: hypothetical protein VK615_03405, partial [Candidatus Binatia bacterium]|nr:hypothetical protein [Candidatus Binatia bacterium]
ELNETNNTAAQFVVLDDPCTSAPVNDAFASAQLVEGRIATILGGNSCATRENGEPRHNNTAATRSIWYRWLPNYTGDATITTFGSTFDTILAVYRGSTLSSLTSVTANDDVSPRLRWSSVNFRVTNGVPQFIAVDGFGGAGGGLALNINPSANDRFTNCLAISGPSGTATGINVGATTETREPAHGPYSVWYCWTAPTNAPFRFDTHGSSFDTRLTAYQGTALSNLTEIAANDDAPGLKTSALLLNAVAGNTYFFTITSPYLFAPGPGEGLVSLTWESAVSPHITSIIPQSADAYRLSISGQTNDQYMVQFSPDLRTWNDRARITNSLGVATYTDNSSTTSGFYRVILLP